MRNLFPSNAPPKCLQEDFVTCQHCKGGEGKHLDKRCACFSTCENSSDNSPCLNVNSNTLSDYVYFHSSMERRRPKCIRPSNVPTGCMHLVTAFAMLATFGGRCNFTASSKLSSYLYCAPELFRGGCQPSWYTSRLVEATLRSVSGPCFSHIVLMIVVWHKVVDVVAT